MQIREPRKVPDWDEFYLGLAYQYASRSKDPDTQCGAVVVDANHIPMGFGTNGAPRQIKDEDLDWSRPKGENKLKSKYGFVRHAEANAIDHCRVNDLNALNDCTMYVTGHPCHQCMIDIVSKGIKRICYGPLAIKMVDQEQIDAAIYVADKAKVKIDKFSGSLNWVLERTKFMEQIGLFK